MSTNSMADVVETTARGTGSVVANVSVPTASNNTTDTEIDRVDAVPDSVVANLDRDGVYTTPTVCVRLASDLSKSSATKTARRSSKNSPNKKDRTGSTTTTSADRNEFCDIATKYMNDQTRRGVISASSDEPKPKTVSATEDAATLPKHIRICDNNFSSRVLAVCSCKDSCKYFIKFLTPAKRREMKDIQKEEDNGPQVNPDDFQVNPEDEAQSPPDAIVPKPQDDDNTRDASRDAACQSITE